MADLEVVKKEVKALVSEITEIPEEELKEDANFIEDLDVDSMMALEIVASIEKKYQISVPEEEIPNLSSLNKIYEMLKVKLA